MLERERYCPVLQSAHQEYPCFAAPARQCDEDYSRDEHPASLSRSAHRDRAVDPDRPGFGQDIVDLVGEPRCFRYRITNFLEGFLVVVFQRLSNGVGHTSPVEADVLRIRRRFDWHLERPIGWRNWRCRFRGFNIRDCFNGRPVVADTWWLLLVRSRRAAWWWLFWGLFWNRF